jgi:Cation transporting ATPase, C-terminus/haloacid dehalogenase-like hydrolase
VRVVMLTGDHPATAKAIAGQAGLPAEDEWMLTGEEVEGLDDQSLAKRLERATIIARTMPLQKLRIIELLRGRGHVVAMTGDGVNDAPALRLADVGVAMGRGGTEVARQAADLLLIDDDFETLAEALVEGRAFWHNMRRALGLLLGGNAGEVGLILASALAGLASPLTTRQVLTINLVTDVLPAVSVAIQQPEHRNLAQLAREGGTALDAPLQADIIRRGVATVAPSFAAYLLASRVSSPAAGSSVAYLSIVATQLAQTIDLGQAEGRLTVPVLAAVGGSLAVVGTTRVGLRARDVVRDGGTGGRRGRSANAGLGGYRRVTRPCADDVASLEQPGEAVDGAPASYRALLTHALGLSDDVLRLLASPPEQPGGQARELVAEMVAPGPSRRRLALVTRRVLGRAHP